MSRIGKIARLPREIREELNRRLDDGEPAGTLLPWLNELPAVRACVGREFEGKGVNSQNLSDWRNGGFAEWQTRREALEQTRDQAADTKELSGATDGPLSDHLANVLVARFAALLAGWNGEVDETFQGKLRVLLRMSHAVAELRRGDHGRGWLKIDEDQREAEREKSEQEVLARFQSWVEDSNVRDHLMRGWKEPAERERHMLAMFRRDHPGRAKRRAERKKSLEKPARSPDGEPLKKAAAAESANPPSEPQSS